MTMRVLEIIPETLAAWMPFYMKEHLKSVGWTVPSSGDATTYNSSGDQITHGGSGAGGLGNTNAWFRMRSPDGAVEFTWQRTVSDSAARIKFARAAMNAGSPSATQTPTTTTATDEIVMLGGGTDAAPTGAGSGFGGGSNGGQHLKGAADDAAPYGFWFATCVASGSGTLSPGTLILDPLTKTIAGDAFPYMIFVKPADLLAGAINLDAPTGLQTYVASATPATAVAMPALSLYDSNNLSVPGDLVTTDDGQFRAFPVRYERRAALANPGYKGISTLLRWVTPKPSRWISLSGETPNESIMFGDLALKWGGEKAVV